MCRRRKQTLPHCTTKQYDLPQQVNRYLVPCDWKVDGTGRIAAKHGRWSVGAASSHWGFGAPQVTPAGFPATVACGCRPAARVSPYLLPKSTLDFRADLVYNGCDRDGPVKPCDLFESAPCLLLSYIMGSGLCQTRRGEGHLEAYGVVLLYSAVERASAEGIEAEPLTSIVGCLAGEVSRFDRAEMDKVCASMRG